MLHFENVPLNRLQYFILVKLLKMVNIVLANVENRTCPKAGQVRLFILVSENRVLVKHILYMNPQLVSNGSKVVTQHVHRLV